MEVATFWAVIKFSNQNPDGSVFIPADRVAGIEKAITKYQQPAQLSAEEESELREASQYPAWARRQKGTVSSWHINK